jgi:hypothetical protein
MNGFHDWMSRGLLQGEWFSRERPCLQILSAQPLGAFLPLLRKKWLQQGYGSRVVVTSDLENNDLDRALQVSSLEEPSVIVIIHYENRKLEPEIIRLCSAGSGFAKIVLATYPQHKLVGEGHALVEITDAIDYESWKLMCSFAYEIDTTIARKLERLMQSLRLYGQQLTLSHAMMLMPYIPVLGRGSEQFLQVWLPHIVQPTVSLFTLAQYLLARDGRNFYALWGRVKELYEHEFWLAYWSDQFWKACHFITAMRSHETQDAAIFAKGLPFSFTRNGWRGYSADFFAALVEMLYEYDRCSKQGGLCVPFELIFHKIITPPEFDEKRLK